MIIDIPTKSDFEKSGVVFLNLAWNSAIGFLMTLAEVGELGYDEVMTDEYWDAAQTPLSTSLALVQQGTEFLLKAHIASVSPFLLLSGNPSNWPRGCDREDTSFADFRSIDAQDLIRVFDTVVSNRLSEEFKQRFERQRRLRNSIAYTVDKNRRVDVEQVLIEILDVAENLVGNRLWMKLRHEYLLSNHEAVTYSTDYVHSQLVRELLKVVDLFEPKETLKFFGFNKRQRRYICLSCVSELGREDDSIPNIAQLQPNTPTSKNVYCAICNTISAVLRRPCVIEGCKGNVIGVEEGQCLTCGEYNDL